ncbi:hypothetical protein CUMW_244140 [Citrus unshiu]|uniref:Uncharacterized protein n=1 Tax=Citrus unshiu TaxID=55188 RepID=A0A2H5QMI9_CITUN|nr:hypothetical protein CUMW_244140 [Citrus unshiu]
MLYSCLKDNQLSPCQYFNCLLFIEFASGRLPVLFSAYLDFNILTFFLSYEAFSCL